MPVGVSGVGERDVISRLLVFLFFQWKYTLFQVLNVLLFFNIKRNGEHKTLRRKYKALLLPRD